MRSIEVRADVETVEYDTFDEALAAALSDAPPGTVVAVHDEECEIDEDNEDTCTCTPLELVAGAQS